MESGKRLKARVASNGLRSVEPDVASRSGNFKAESPILPFKLRSCKTRYKPLKGKTNDCRLTKAGKRSDYAPEPAKAEVKANTGCGMTSASQGVET
jgi:hypothetical protein